VELLPAAERDVRQPHCGGADGVSSARDSRRRCPSQPVDYWTWGGGGGGMCRGSTCVEGMRRSACVLRGCKPPVPPREENLSPGNPRVQLRPRGVWRHKMGGE
jgi:hypothetical protein